jgi:lysophospholipase L1-like esterase
MKPWIIRTSLALNVLILALCVGVWLGRDQIIQSVLERMATARISFFDSFPGTQSDVVMLGDSITAGGEWSEMFPGLPIRNRGISGDTTTDVLLRLDPLVAAKPAAVFLKIGTNDLNRVPDRAVSYQQYRQIVTRIQSGSPATAIFLQSVLPREAAMREEVEAYNRQIKAVADELGVVYIDLYPAFLAADGSIRDELTLDELHLSGEGYRVWQSLLEPVMRAANLDSRSAK